ncbi:uncharacterized protein KRP23_7854 [Phytophthora ramorum]|uniref:uncharacterized protein n=1 Tax=Phytophthora ramorum TaxID=164328 RepID=UPI0030B049D9|nr:hypothetical protein KRP23_7854 [Phytophthora ramorum]
MATDEGGLAPEPGKEPAANGTPSPGKRNVNKARRLLPMELRKRRRAAKLQVSAQKKARVSLDPPQTPVKPASKGAEEVEAGTLRSSVALQKGIEARAVGSPAPAMNQTSTLARSRQKSPLATGVTAATLSSLYSSSLLSRKRNFRPGANVSTTFHVADLPLDVVPKAKLSILTAYPYPFQRTNSQIKKQALQSFIAANGNSAEESGYQTTAVRWQQALHYFVHPADSVPTSILLNRATAATTNEPLLGGPKGERKRKEKAFFTARWNTWQEAFRDAYMNFRRQASSSTEVPDNSFYLRSSEFVVCFLHGTDDRNPTEDAEEGPTSIINLCHKHDEETEAAEKNQEGTKRTKKRQLCAVMSQSNSRIRKGLHHLNVEYTMPYINTNQTQREVGAFHLLEEELEATRSGNKDKRSGGLIAPVARTVSTPENMHGTESLLLFHGHDAVHGLYEFLINRAPMSNQDVPELYTLHPFTNASIQSLQVTSFGRVGGSAADPPSEDQPSRAATLFRTEILGFCFPSSVAKLQGVLKDEWEATKASYGSAAEVSQTGKHDAQIALRTYMEAVAGAERLNAVKLGAQTTGPGEKRGDLRKRQQELEFSKRRVEAVMVTKMESRYDVETTTRTIVARR